MKKQTGGVRLFLFLTSALLLAGLLAACKPSPVLQQVIYKQDTSEVDKDNLSKIWDYDKRFTDRSDQLFPQMMRKDSPDKRDRINEKPVPGDSGTEGAPKVNHDADAKSELQSQNKPQESQQEQETGTERQGAGGTSEEADDLQQTDGGTDQQGTGTQGGSPDLSGETSMRQVVNAYGVVVDIPQEVSRVTAVGEAAVLVQMLGGEGCLVGSNTDFLSYPLGISVFGDEGISNIAALWQGGGSTPLTAGAFAELLTLKPQACLDLSGQTAFSAEQIAALKTQGIAYIVLPPLNTTDNLLLSVQLVGDILGDRSREGGQNAPALAADYAAWFRQTEQNVGGGAKRFAYKQIDFDNDERTNGTVYLKDASIANHEGLYTLFVSGWDADAHYKLHTDSSVTLEGDGMAVVRSGYSQSPLSYFMSLGGVVNAGAVYPDYGVMRSWYVNPLTTNTKRLTVSGGYGQTTANTLTRVEAVGLGEQTFPNLVVASGSIKSRLEADPLWQPYPRILSSSGLTTEHGFLDSAGNIVTTSIRGEYQVLVNPRGVGSWTDGSAESILEALWIADKFSGTVSQTQLENAVRNFYRAFYRHQLTEDQLASILNGPD